MSKWVSELIINNELASLWMNEWMNNEWVSELMNEQINLKSEWVSK